MNFFQMISHRRVIIITVTVRQLIVLPNGDCVFVIISIRFDVFFVSAQALRAAAGRNNAA